MFEIENRTYFVQVLFNKKIFRVKFSCVFYFTYDFQFLKVFEEFYFFLCGFDWVLVGLLSVGKFDAFYPIVEWFLSFYIKFFYKIFYFCSWVVEIESFFIEACFKEIGDSRWCVVLLSLFPDGQGLAGLLPDLRQFTLLFSCLFLLALSPTRLVVVACAGFPAIIVDIVYLCAFFLLYSRFCYVVNSHSFIEVLLSRLDGHIPTSLYHIEVKLYLVSKMILDSIGYLILKFLIPSACLALSCCSYGILP